MNALYSNTTGSGNIAIGQEALYTATGVDFQTAVGYQALRNSTTGTQNIALGYSAGSSITTGSNNIAIGYNAQVPSGTSSNQLAIGNWIYGSGGFIGIGTAIPGAKLEVAGQVKITGGTPGVGKVLTSDAAGLATWQTPTTAASITGVLDQAPVYKVSLLANGEMPVRTTSGSFISFSTISTLFTSGQPTCPTGTTRYFRINSQVADNIVGPIRYVELQISMSGGANTTYNM